ncbi:ubiquinol-cytochrome C reductase hinge domain-containing protein [Absidia repens]|uniref:Ubiquinol-cytochrome C reductase hinge domain-containing protein n=1 Tax=Absidia repens TaxID=90262 RepID=A0A1X2ISC7_9FUNG|nr:ubiquinol-cytochrome C reductase hinge domain-containing protein [Absidia repens]
MGLSEFISNFIPTVYAEEAETVVAVEEEAASVEAQAEELEAEAVAEAEEAEEEEEEEEEPEDPKEAIMEECAKQCPSLKHHLDECNERVENGSSENCIEEFFHFMHCADECAAPKIFATTK